MPNLKSQIESLLYISNKPLTAAKLAELAGAEKGAAEEALKALEEEYDKRENSGIRVLRQGDKVQMATSPDNAEIIQGFLKDEVAGELTRPSLETLTIVAYRGPISKAELEQIRGVNCSLILRNLMIKGLVESSEDKKMGVALYGVTFDFLRHLGISAVGELPDYEKLSQAETLDKLLNLPEREPESVGGKEAAAGEGAEETEVSQ
jgi:segregation and condensation protein B